MSFQPAFRLPGFQAVELHQAVISTADRMIGAWQKGNCIHRTFVRREFMDDFLCGPTGAHKQDHEQKETGTNQEPIPAAVIHF